MYAFKKTVRTLSTVLTSDNDHIVVLAFLVSAIGFGSMEIAFNRGFNNISAAIVSGVGTATLFFLSIVGFFTFISTLFVFAYYLSISPGGGRKRSKPSFGGRAWRMALSFVFAGAATAAAFNFFSDGLREVTFMRAQYALFLSDGAEAGVLTPLVAGDLGRRFGPPHGSTPADWREGRRSSITAAAGDPPVAAGAEPPK
jgi:hypothetical protein